jgi:DnaJ homolog subfamily A member 5
VYRDLFDTLGRQEVAAWEASDAAGGAAAKAPTLPCFGGPDAAAADVHAFYSYWGNFTSYKDFSWADEYNPAAAPNRQVSGQQAAVGSGPGVVLCGAHHAKPLCVQ